MMIDRAKWRVTIYREAEATATLQLDYDTSGGTARGYDCHFEHALKVVCSDRNDGELLGHHLARKGASVL
ncbi:hypothetical protein ANO14919_103010 [Xylariales sp. No.14919]|nr:hypothetical protein ANO14919_103010 [Xylariales sp. No.14919]